jgi:hypothetical protein
LFRITKLIAKIMETIEHQKKNQITAQKLRRKSYGNTEEVA